MNILSILLFSFALLTDTHISTSNPHPMEDLQRSIADINQNPNIEFVAIERCATVIAPLHSAIGGLRATRPTE